MRRGLSLIEIIVSMIVLSLVLAGLANVFVVGKTYLRNNQLRLEALEYAKNDLDRLHEEIRADQPVVDSNNVTSKDGVTYTINRVNTKPVAGSDLLRVSVRVEWKK